MGDPEESLTAHGLNVPPSVFELVLINHCDRASPLRV